MRRLAIVEYMMSAGGVERVLRGLAGAFLEIPEARDWEITFLLSRYTSAHRPSEWPAELTGPNLRVEWLGQETATARLLDRLAHAQGLWGIPLSKPGGFVAARLARRIGPRWWRGWLGDPETLIGQASRRFDLLYFTYPVLMGVPDMQAPVVTTPQDFNYLHFFEEDHPTRRKYETATRAWLARSDRVLLTTEAVRDELARFYPEHASKSQVIHLGVAAEAPGSGPTSAQVEEFRRAHDLPDRFVLMAGWVLEHKNQLALVEALARLRERGLSIPAVFVGPNAVHLVESRELGFPEGYPGKVRAALRDAGLVHRKDFFTLGYVSDAAIRCLYRLATVFVLPSLYEGFGLPSLEAMQSGCPTILSAIPPLLEQNRLLGDVARTFDPKDPAALADELEWVLTHGEEAREMAHRAAQKVPAVYDWRKTARSYLAAFAEVVDAARARSGRGGA